MRKKFKIEFLNSFNCGSDSMWSSIVMLQKHCFWQQSSPFTADSRFQLVCKHGRMSLTINSPSMFHIMFQNTRSTLVTLLEVIRLPDQSSPVSFVLPFLNLSTHS
jgi:hypothetical protein